MNIWHFIKCISVTITVHSDSHLTSLTTLSITPTLDYYLPMNRISFAQIHSQFKSGSLTPTQLAQTYIDHISTKNPKTNAFITKTFDIALSQALESENRWKAGKPRSIIDGIPFSIKDAFCTQGIRTTMASKVLQDFVPQYNATAYQKLLDAGGIVLGKTNLDEFAVRH